MHDRPYVVFNYYLTLVYYMQAVVVWTYTARHSAFSCR